MTRQVHADNINQYIQQSPKLKVSIMNPCFILTFLFALRAETFKLKVNVCFSLTETELVMKEES